MSFTVPTFNISCNIWTHGVSPIGNLPRLTSVCNLAYGPRVAQTNFGSGICCMSLLLPPGTDIRSGVQTLATGDTVECPPATGRYYAVANVDDIGKGFPNEHRVALLVQTSGFAAWPTPMP